MKFTSKPNNNIRNANAIIILIAATMRLINNKSEVNYKLIITSYVILILFYCKKI